MFRLYGFSVSNYVNMVNLALLEKGLPFDFVLTTPDQSPEFLVKSPPGAMPRCQASSPPSECRARPDRFMRSLRTR